VSDDEVTQGRAVLSAVVPADWPDGVLTVTVAGETSTLSVSGFAQRQRFGLPLDGDALSQAAIALATRTELPSVFRRSSLAGISCRCGRATWRCWKRG
jgi:hypothetical protein